MKKSHSNLHNVINFAPKPKSIGIVGGMGQMGQLLAPKFRASGYEVHATGKVEGVSERTLRRANYHILRDCDVVVLAVPIPELCKGLDHIFGTGAFRGLRGKLIWDISSTKSEPMHAMAAAAGASVIGCHPLLGPSVQQMAGKHIILTPLVRGSYVMDTNMNAWAAWLADWWKEQGAAVHFLTPEEHDRLMAIIQVAVLAQAAFFATAIERMGIPLETLMEISTPNSLVVQAVAGRMLSANMAPTYANLATDNRYAVEVTEAMRDAAIAFHALTEAKDAASLEARLRSLAASISPAFREQAMALTKKFEAAAVA